MNKNIVLWLSLLFANQLCQAMQPESKIFVAGHNGLVGSAICRALKKAGYQNLVVRSSKEVNLCNQAAVENFFMTEQPEYVFLVAAKVGGVYANMSHPSDFIYQNLMIEANVIHAAYKYGVKKLIFIGSSCIYPRDCPQPIKEQYLLTQPLEPTNEWYGLAKIVGIKLCQAYNQQYQANFISCAPTNIYGPGDKFTIENAHVVAALIRKFCDAKEKEFKEVSIYGTGNALREFLYVDDLAEATIFLMQNYNDNSPINIGSGSDISIRDLAEKIKALVGFDGEIVFDKTKPDGNPKRLLDTSRINQIGWKAKTDLDHGLKNTIDWYIQNKFKSEEVAQC